MHRNRFLEEKCRYLVKMGSFKIKVKSKPPSMNLQLRKANWPLFYAHLGLKLSKAYKVFSNQVLLLSCNEES